MNEQDRVLKEIFTEQTELPSIVTERVEEAYASIQDKAREEKESRQERKTARHARHLPKAAGILIACVLTVGSTAAAATAILTRWDRMQEMDPQTVTDYYEEFQNGGNLSYLPSRSLTQAESERFDELQAAYNRNERFPVSELAHLQEDEAYAGTGVALRITDRGEEHILYLPEEELTDEDLLEIIEYLAKQDYVFYETSREQILSKGNWESRLAEMTDEEVDYYYLAFCKGKMPTMDGYCRGGEKNVALNVQEATLYEQLLTEYEEENRIPTSEVTVIEYGEDYTGEGVAICRYDGNFYLPEKSLTQEELLEIIDFRKKAYYAQTRIDEEIRLGYRTGYPELPGVQSDITESLPEIASKDFANTAGKGRQTTIDEAHTGDIITFGTYDQDNDPSDGQEPIEWYVLEETDGTLTLLSVQLLDEGVYDSDLENPVTWESCELRQWLNGTFYEIAFSPAEQAHVLTTTLKNTEGADTNDQVWLLSSEEFYAYFGVQPDPDRCKDGITSYDDALKQGARHYEICDERIFAEATKTAVANGVWQWSEETTKSFLQFKNIDFSYANGKSSWLLRNTCEKFGPSIHVIDATGIFDSHQYRDSLSYGIRPVIRINR